jgi:ribosomal protein S18 acetylase RimI-like enzyme
LDIRRATKFDVLELSTLSSQVFLSTYGGTAPVQDIASHVESYFSEAIVGTEILRDDVSYLMAVDGQRCAGMLKIREGDLPDVLRGQSVVEVQQLYVSPDFQRRGVGGLLLDAAVAETRERGMGGIWLSVWADADWAMNFYTRYGFISLAEIPFMMADTEFVDHVMWLPVSD